MVSVTDLDKQKEEIASQKVRDLYQELFDVPFPFGWRIEWSLAGLTIPESKLVCFFVHPENASRSLSTIVHELLHVRNLTHSHNSTFLKECEEFTRKADCFYRWKVTRKKEK